MTLFLESGSGLTNAGHIQANGVDIQANYNSFPFVVDWNDDGKKDLIVGEQSPQSPNTGNVRIYLNQGTNSSPQFGNYDIIYAGPSQLYKFRANPVVYDLDMDGLKDLIVGNDDGRVYFYKNVGTNAAPVFNASYDTLRMQNGVAITVGSISRIHFVDWTGDGDLDLLVGGYAGYVQLYENTTYTGIEEGKQYSLVIKGYDITPNPIAHAARISYSLDTPARVLIEVFSVDGRILNTIVDGLQQGGHHETIFAATDGQARDLPAGIYLIRLEAARETKTKSIVVTR